MTSTNDALLTKVLRKYEEHACTVLQGKTMQHMWLSDGNSQEDNDPHHPLLRPGAAERGPDPQPGESDYLRDFGRFGMVDPDEDMGLGTKSLKYN